MLNTGLGTLEPTERKVTRVFGAAQREYTSTYAYSPTNSGDYHQPISITETGDAGTRTTVRAYQHLQAPYVVALPTSEAVSAGGETYQYDSGTAREPSCFSTRNWREANTKPFRPSRWKD